MRVAMLLVVTSCSLDPNPARVSFGGSAYDVRYGDDVCLAADNMIARCLGSGILLAYDFTGDGVDDLALYTDDRDGFRKTFSYLDIYANTGMQLADANPATAKWKEGHWAWIDPVAYPGLYGAKFERFMRAQDAAHD